jgi:hypothetical protein
MKDKGLGGRGLVVWVNPRSFVGFLTPCPRTFSDDRAGLIDGVDSDGIPVV